MTPHAPLLLLQGRGLMGSQTRSQACQAGTNTPVSLHDALEQKTGFQKKEDGTQKVTEGDHVSLNPKTNGGESFEERRNRRFGVRSGAQASRRGSPAHRTKGSWKRRSRGAERTPAEFSIRPCS
ncbi:hypothetical protein NDU88_004017 [Pleurodeles waltl]|uniref:Uncharacterized protein n=1 Tax=Pleurodeles waltl TaxID=8319 RepID=A0AAV7UHZ4_PLEWA|nr:hypothetical protein NDU88_004017 [Pleurodeles waltl]